MSNMKTYDPYVCLRTAILGAAIGWLARFGVSPETGAVLGGVLGALYDLIAFYVKTRFSADAPEGRA